MEYYIGKYDFDNGMNKDQSNSGCKYNGQNVG